MRGWFTTSAPAIGYEVAERPYGFLGRTVRGTRLILRLDSPEDIACVLADAAAFASGADLVVWVDDRTRAVALGPGLAAAGWRAGAATTHLALVGDLQARDGPEDLVVTRIGDERLEEWARVKLQAFSDSEETPSDDALERETALRRSERPLADHVLALENGEPVAVLAHYIGADQLVFNLGTRLPFRHRGIAQALLAHFAAAGRAQGCRSLMINAHEGELPSHLYRRIGFTDEVYWYRSYSRRREEDGGVFRQQRQPA